MHISQFHSSSFAGLEKDVLLLTKNTPGQSFSSFMGKGIIPLPPDFVFNSLRNPQLRFMYDNMLKVSRLISDQFGSELISDQALRVL